MATRYEFNNTDDSNELGYSTQWVGQTFTPSVTHIIKSVVLRASYKLNPIGNVIVKIRATAAGLPTGADLASGSLAVNGNLALFPILTVITVPLGVGQFLVAGTKYAILMYSDNDINNGVYFRYQWATNPYAGGWQVTSADTGVTWGDFVNQLQDVYFEDWGIVYSDVSNSNKLVSVSLL